MAKTNHLKRSVPRLLTPIALAIVLSACSSVSLENTMSGVDITQEPTLSSDDYMLKAETSFGQNQSNWLIMALKATIDEQQIGKANLLFFKLTNEELNDSQLAEWQLARARLLIDRQQSLAALKQLTFESTWEIDSSQWLRYYEIRSEILIELERWTEATRSLIHVYHLSEEPKRAKLSELIWETIGHSNQSELEQLDISPAELQLNGWVELATYVKANNANISHLKELIEQWLIDNPHHAATLYTPESIASLLSMQFIVPKNPALLLPLSGKFAKQAEIIREGFMFAQANDDSPSKITELKIIDTQEQDLYSITDDLVASEIDFIVGPLVKDNIVQLKQIMALQSKEIPMLALNIPAEVDPTMGTCYFGLSPQQEADQTAKYFAAQEYQFPMVLAPEGSYGQRVVEAFQKEWANHSEHPVAVGFIESTNKMQININTAMGLQTSRQNIAKIQSILGRSLEGQPRNRRDIDAIYIAADNRQLTLIKPFIEVAVNPEAPQPKLYAGSRSHTADKQYEDLSGVIYSDIPLLISPQEEIKAQMDINWPNASNAETRLRAMGMDAYALLNELPQMKTVSGYEISGQTGLLTIDEQCVIHRNISWAEHGAG
ncbi:penicillin-binding protein activator [Vibrio sp. RC27]